MGLYAPATCLCDKLQGEEHRRLSRGRFRVARPSLRPSIARRCPPTNLGLTISFLGQVPSKQKDSKRMRPPGKSPLERAYATIAVTIAWITGLTHSATCCGTPRIKLTLRIHQLEAVSKAEPLDRPAFVPGTPRNSSFMLVLYQLATQKKPLLPLIAL